MSRSISRFLLALAVACTAGSLRLAAQTAPLQVEHDVTVGSMVSDRFTWRDSSNLPRLAVLAHNDGQTGPGGTRGGEIREFRYQVGATTRVVAASASGASGFGYVVAHPDDSEPCLGGFDSSTLGHFVTGTFTRVFEGRHHAIFRFTQTYPRYCSTAAAAPTSAIGVPVTIEWVFATGKDNPLWSITYDLSGIAAGLLQDDSRAPYGELLFDGSATEGGHSVIAGVGWGDAYKFASTAANVTLESAWTWNTANSVPYVKLWTTAVDATMGVVQTQTLAQQDAGGYWGVNRWNSTSAAGNGCTVAIGGVDTKMPCTFNWPYQSINYSFTGLNTTTNSTRLAWGANFGFLGQGSYYRHGSAYYGGPLPDTTASGWPRQSYSTYVVLGQHSTQPVEAQVTQVETVQSLNVTAVTGTALTAGAGGVGRSDTVTYQPAGYNHVYGALAFAASANRLDANVAVGSGILRKPLIIVSGYSGGTPVVKLGGTQLTADVDYFASLRTPANELWLTLNRNLTGATNHLELAPAGGVSGSAISLSGDFDGDGKSDLVWRYSSGQVAIWLMNGASIVFGNVVGTADPSWKLKGVADFNGDGRSDLLFHNTATGEVAIWLMNGPSIAATSVVTTVDARWNVEATGDFNGDGKGDIFWRNTLDGTAAMWLMNGTTIAFGNSFAPIDLTWHVIGVADFNGDGKSDLMWRSTTDQLAMWLLNGPSIVYGNVIATIAPEWKLRADGDFDGDGKGDVVFQNTSTGQVAMWMMDGSAIKSSSVFQTVDSRWKIEADGDFNGDGRSDLFWRDTTTGGAAMWQMNGTSILFGDSFGSIDLGWSIAPPRPE